MGKPGLEVPFAEISAAQLPAVKAANQRLGDSGQGSDCGARGARGGGGGRGGQGRLPFAFFLRNPILWWFFKVCGSFLDGHLLFFGGSFSSWNGLAQEKPREKMPCLAFEGQPKSSSAWFKSVGLLNKDP